MSEIERSRFSDTSTFQAANSSKLFAYRGYRNPVVVACEFNERLNGDLFHYRVLNDWLLNPCISSALTYSCIGPAEIACFCIVLYRPVCVLLTLTQNPSDFLNATPLLLL